MNTGVIRTIPQGGNVTWTQIAEQRPAQTMTGTTDNNLNNVVSGVGNTLGTTFDVVDHMDTIPFAGDLATVWDIANTGVDVVNTLTNNDLTWGQRAARTGIQVGGTAASIGVGKVTGAIGAAGVAAAPKTFGVSLAAIPYAVYTNRRLNQGIDQLQNNLLDRWDLR